MGLTSCNFFPYRAAASGYVDWMGKVPGLRAHVRVQARMYNDLSTLESRCNRFRRTCSIPAPAGSAADWQPTCDLIQAGTLVSTSSARHHALIRAVRLQQQRVPGSIDVWVNGGRSGTPRVPRTDRLHGASTTSCRKRCRARSTSAPWPWDGWFPGAIGKAAIYDYLPEPGRRSARTTPL